ncbi:hypothetical protein BUALT_Bualt15G0013200 [Buddleja alternifolia]|uniref:Dirigent protein n=1 Tax=Buddleja alternifolia TaxID=168488 RepID=A0AAV6WJH7_9LAMI|nr:hypothetical protein BUALT_Bualt15G0013200 [Buddleja alternifolia]
MAKSCMFLFCTLKRVNMRLEIEMEKLCIILMIFFLVIVVEAATKEKLTKLRFFVEDTFTGANQTAYKVAQSNITSTSPSLFGQVNVVDAPFTMGPKAKSKILGRAQGIVGFADLNEIGFHMSITFVFTSGKYKGSTLSMMGRNNLLQKHRQMPIVGGTGAFAMAKGIATTSNYYFDTTTDNAVFEYKIIVNHY